MRSVALMVVALSLASSCDRCGEEPLCDPTASTKEVDGIWTIEGEGERTGCDDPRHNGSFKLGPSSNLAVDQSSEIVSEPGVSVEAGLPDFGPLEAGTADASEPDTGGPEAGTSDLDWLEAGTPDAGPLDLSVLEAGSPGDGQVDGVTGDALPDAVPDRRGPDRRYTPTPSYRQVLRLSKPLQRFSLNGEVQGDCVSFETVESELTGTLRYQFSGKAESSRRIEGRFTGTGPAGCLSSGTFTVEIH
jgi:hypothetical protein